MGAGDIADCRDLSGAEATAKLLEQITGTVMVPGDLAYPDGSKENFECYDKTWGRVKSRTRPSPGNHEFHAAGATPYFDYFGSAAGDPKNGYYSYELGTWHIIVLNSECIDVGGCDAGSRQEKWLRGDLAAHPRGLHSSRIGTSRFLVQAAPTGTIPRSSRYGKRCTTPMPMLSSTATTTTTSVSRLKHPTAQPILRAAFGNSSLAQAARITAHSALPSRTAKYAMRRLSVS